MEYNSRVFVPVMVKIVVFDELDIIARSLTDVVTPEVPINNM